MNDQELADKVVALGVGRHLPSDEWAIIGQVGLWQTTFEFVRDWRVVGALLEKLLAIDVLKPIMVMSAALASFYEGNLPRAIIEACVEALSC